jgi:predicted nucleotidyltransferase component of viral defense system
VHDGPRLYLRLGDHVVHLRYEEWGNGVVVEEMTSTLIGGTCLVRILFEDGQQRTFSNDLDSDICCYYFGIRRQSHPLFDSERRRTTRTSAAKRLSQE